MYHYQRDDSTWDIGALFESKVHAVRMLETHPLLHGNYPISSGAAVSVRPPHLLQDKQEVCCRVERILIPDPDPVLFI